MADEFDFSDLAEIKIPVKFRGQVYTLKEATGEVAIKHRNAAVSGMAIIQDDDTGTKTIKMGAVGTLDIILVSGCLFDDKEKPVPESLLRTWPTRVITQLADKVKEISLLNEQDSLEDLISERDKLNKRIAKLQGEQDPKKSSGSDTTDGSA